MGAVRAGAFNLYPSCNPKQEDAMEARFLFIPTGIKGGGDRTRKMRQERFLEYGKNELLVYVRVAVAIGDTHRLFPDVLAAADPQMFWSAVFRHRALCKLLKSMVKKHIEIHAIKHDAIHAEKRAKKLAKRRARKRVKKSMVHSCMQGVTPSLTLLLDQATLKEC